MKVGKLYIKILLSFLVVLIVAEGLIFGLFRFSAGRILRTRFEQIARAQALTAKELVEEKINSARTAPTENESLKRLIAHLGEMYRAKVWLASPGGAPLLKSFQGDIPRDAAKISKRRAENLGSFKMYYGFEERAFYIVIPTEIGKGEIGSLHILSEEIETDLAEGVFALGLLGIGIVIALLIVPVSRLMTDPLKRLKHSALRIAEGDLTHRATVRSKDEIGELGRSFNHMADRLQKMIRGSKELTANVSHELRSPLARIRVAEELLRERLERSDHNDSDRYLDDIRDDIGELDRLIGRILFLSKLEIHETPLKHERLDPSDLINEILGKFKPAMNHRGLQVTTDLSLTPPIFVDSDALRTALSNILDNAVKFTPENGHVVVKTHSEYGHLKISVENSFEALSEEDLERIFEPFHRTEQSRTSGSGLGLAITKKIIERQGGSIEASNSLEGFKIQMSLPAGPSA